MKTEPTALARIGAALRADDAVALSAATGVGTLCCAVGAHMVGVPRYGRQGLAVREAGDDVLRRAVWTLSYWCGLERVADARWGFAPLRVPHAPA